MSTYAENVSLPSIRATPDARVWPGALEFGIRGEVRGDFGQDTAWVLCEVPTPALVTRIVLHNDDTGGHCAYYVRHDDDAFGKIWERLRFRVGQRANGIDVYALHELAPVQARLPLTQDHDAIIEAYVDPQQRIHRQMRFTSAGTAPFQPQPPRTYVSAARPNQGDRAPGEDGAIASLVAQAAKPLARVRPSVSPAPPPRTTSVQGGGPSHTLRPEARATHLTTATEALDQEGYFNE